MRGRLVLVALALAALAGSAAVPASDDPSLWSEYFVARGHLVEVGQTGGAGEADMEVQLWAWTGEVLLSSEPYDDELWHCVSLFDVAAKVFEEGCGALEVIPGPAMSVTAVQGSIASTVYDYDPTSDNWFEPIGQSNIHVDLTLVGTGTPRLGEPQVGPGVCGLPPDTRGVLFFGEVSTDRPADTSGTLSSEYLGDVDTSLLTGHLYEGVFAWTGACVEGL